MDYSKSQTKIAGRGRFYGAVCALGVQILCLIISGIWNPQTTVSEMYFYGVVILGVGGILWFWCLYISYNKLKARPGKSYKPGMSVGNYILFSWSHYCKSCKLVPQYPVLYLWVLAQAVCYDAL